MNDETQMTAPLLTSPTKWGKGSILPLFHGGIKGGGFLETMNAEARIADPLLTSPMEWGKNFFLPPLRGGIKGGSFYVWVENQSAAAPCTPDK
jgi:hypothetical protein